MRTPIIAGNWKMHLTIAESVAFVKELVPILAPHSGVEQVVGPTFVALAAVAEALQGSPIKVAAQQMHWEDNGAYTSQIAPGMIKGLVEYVIIGHSECRQYLNETDETVNKKAKAALAYGLKPIIAVGESLEERESGRAGSVITHQVQAALKDIPVEALERVVLAYEPIWAIGTGRNASGEIAQETIGGSIRATLISLYGETVASKVRIQYGGSVKPENMHEYMSQPDIDGALVGGASLKADSFAALIRAAAEAKGV